MGLLKELQMLWKGYVLLLVQGSSPEAFLNRLVRKEISLYNVSRQDEKLTILMLPRDMHKIRHTVKRQLRPSITILEKGGLPFWIQFAGKRQGLFIGCLLFMLIVSALGSLVWGVEVQGQRDTDKASILACVEEMGMGSGSLRRHGDIKALERYIVKSIPLISWVDARWQGTVLEIEIVEKDVLLEPDRNLYAKQSGYIEEMILLRGEAHVQAGDTVQKGELLIQSHDHRQAAALVRARTWYQGTAVIPLLFQESRCTGRWAFSISLGSSDEIFSVGVAESPFPHYTVEKNGISFLGLWVQCVWFHEKTQYVHYVSGPTAAYYARDQALREALSQMDNQGEILSIQTKKQVKDSVFMEVQVLLEVLENIVQGGGAGFDEKGNHYYSHQ